MKWLKPNWLIVGIAILLLIVAIWFFVDGARNNEQFSANLATEFLSIAITVLVIDGIYRWRDKLHEHRLNERLAEDRKQEIIEQMGSPVNDAALEAVRLAKKNGWLEDFSFKNANLPFANLKGADLKHAYLRGAILKAANLEGADLGGANLEGADLKGANLQDADLSAASLLDANLEGANLEGANLMLAHLPGAKLARVNFKGADLRATYLEGADLYGVCLEGAKCNIRTIWPDGFDFRTKGKLLNEDDEG